MAAIVESCCRTTLSFMSSHCDNFVLCVLADPLFTPLPFVGEEEDDEDEAEEEEDTVLVRVTNGCPIMSLSSSFSVSPPLESPSFSSCCCFSAFSFFILRRFASTTSFPIQPDTGAARSKPNKTMSLRCCFCGCRDGNCDFVDQERRGEVATTSRVALVLNSGVRVGLVVLIAFCARHRRQVRFLCVFRRGTLRYDRLLFRTQQQKTTQSKAEQRNDELNKGPKSTCFFHSLGCSGIRGRTNSTGVMWTTKKKNSREEDAFSVVAQKKFRSCSAVP